MRQRHALSRTLSLSIERQLPCEAVCQTCQDRQALDATSLCSYKGVLVLQDRVEGAALLEAAELHGDDSEADLNDSDADSDADLNDSDADSDIDVGSSDNDLEVHGSEAAESDGEDTQPDGLESAADVAVASEVGAVSEHESGLEGEASESNREEHEEEQSEGSGSDGGLEEAADSPLSSEKQEEEEEAAPGRGRKRKAQSLDSDLQCSEDTAAAESPIRAPHADEEQDEEDGQEEEEDKGDGQKKSKNAKPKLQPAADSLQTLKRQLAAAKGTGDGGDGKDGQTGVPIEWGRVLTAEDFERIKQLRHRCTVPTCLCKTQHNCFQSYVKSDGRRCMYAKCSGNAVSLLRVHRDLSSVTVLLLHTAVTVLLLHVAEGNKSTA